MLHDLAHLGQVDLALFNTDIQPQLQCIELQFLVPWNLSFLLKKSLPAENVKKLVKIEQTPSRFGQNRVASVSASFARLLKQTFAPLKVCFGKCAETDSLSLLKSLFRQTLLKQTL